MKILLTALAFIMALNANAQRTLSNNTRAVNLDTVSQTVALTINEQGNLSLVDLPNGGSGGGINNMERYNSEVDFPEIGNETIIYYAKTENEFYLWENDTQEYRLAPVSVKSVAAGLYLQNNGTSKDPVLDVQTSQFIQSIDAGPVRNSAINNTLNNISLTGRITKSPVSYRTYSGTDIVSAGGTIEELLASIPYDTDFIAISASGITYLLKRNDIQVNKVLDSQGNIVNFTFYRNDLPNNIFTRRYGFFNINSTPKSLTNLNPNYTAYSYNALDDGTGGVFIQTSSTTDQYTVMYSVVSAVSGAAAETVTTLVNNGDSFTYTSENGTVTNINLGNTTGTSNGNIITANSLTDITNAGPEIISAIDSGLGQTDWKTGGAIDYSQNAVYQSSSSLSPTMSLINSSNTRYRTYAQGNIAYVESTDPTTGTPKELRFNTSAIKFVNPTDLGSSSSPARDIYADRNIFANEFRKSGGTNNQFLKAGGGVDSNTYLQAIENVLTNTSVTLDLNDNYKRIRATTGTISYTIPLNSTVAFDPDNTEITIINTGATSVTIATENPSIILLGSAGDVISSGEKRTLLKLDTDTWFVGY